MGNAMESIVYFDAEIGADDHKILDIGALWDSETFHSASAADFWTFAADARYLCGHNYHSSRFEISVAVTPDAITGRADYIRCTCHRSCSYAAPITRS